MLTSDILQSIDESVLCWLATVNSDGVPNVAPKQVFAAYGSNELIIANIASPTSVHNIRVNPAVCVSFVHVFKQKGYKLLGRAELLTRSHHEFEARYQPLYAIAGETFPIASIIRVAVTAVEPIIAPRYKLYPDTTEQSQIKDALSTYGVKSADS